eukprot:m.269588 g.269588  ORF g.269588 m.269588 type:complete len:234 (-) comp22822_c0_seq5:37-738(-)
MRACTLMFVTALATAGVLLAVSATSCGTAKVRMDADGRLVLSDCFNATTLGGLLDTIQQQGSTIQQQWSIIRQLQSVACHVNIPQQTTPTYGAYDWEWFSVDSTNFLVVANFRNTGGNYNTDSVVYQWDSMSFITMQAIPTQGAVDWEWFSISGGIYLVVANQNSGSNSAVNSVIYLWSGSAFVNQQMIPTRGANDWEYFSMDGNNYLVVANRASSTNLDIGSVIYQWNGCHF